MTTNTTVRAGGGRLIDPERLSSAAAPFPEPEGTCMTTRTARHAGTHTTIDLPGGGRATDLPLLGIIAAVMNQIPGMNRQPERSADKHPDAVPAAAGARRRDG